METIFITIHDLSLDARIKYCSDSIEDVLGYRPNEVKGKSCWEYFHPDEIPFARAIHGRGLELEKAAALNYCRIKHSDGRWVGCECVFTVVYDVLVASTSIYQRGHKSQRKAVEGATVRRIFSSSPRDPRYHMLSYISNKFTQSYAPQQREPRAALILNRFTRNSTIMYATGGVEQIVGFPSMQLIGKSFYYCIAENCLSQAVRTVESAKGNDSIAYLRFFFRDPTLPDPPQVEHGDSESDESDDGGVPLTSRRTSRSSSSEMTSASSVVDGERVPQASINSPQPDGIQEYGYTNNRPQAQFQEVDGIQTQTSSASSTDLDGNTPDRVFDRPLLPAQSSASSIMPHDSHLNSGFIEVEAVVSCSSDGLVVVLRKAHPMPPQVANQDQPQYPNGLFASPWAAEPVMPSNVQQRTSAPDILDSPTSGSAELGFMSAIREVAVFAWSLTGINGSLVDKAIGTPSGEAMPPGGLPVWDPNAAPGQNDAYNGFSGSTHRPLVDMGEADGVIKADGKVDGEVTSSDDEILWKRAPEMPAYKKPKRRAHHDAFGIDGEEDSTDGGAPHGQDRRRRKLDNGDRSTSR